MEVWQANNTNSSLSGALDMTAATNALAAYAMLAAGASVLERTYVNQTMTQGVFYLGSTYMNGVFPGSAVTVVLAAWNTGAASWTDAGAAGAKARPY